ncbi:hypothetical protein BHE74_00037108 [Ensete ventricosum]|nr:hypothetical protein BHE74_00037108 [Ensete ventricosum]
MHCAHRPITGPYRYRQNIGTRYGPVVGTRTARYRAVPPKIDHRQPIEGEFDRWRSNEGEKGKKKKKRKRKKKKREEEIIPSARAPSLPAGHGRFFSHARRWNVSPREEKDLCDVFHIDLYRSYKAVHTGPPGYRYMDRPLLGGTEIDRRRSIEGEKRKKKKKRKRRRKKKKEYLATSSPVCRRHPRL